MTLLKTCLRGSLILDALNRNGVFMSALSVRQCALFVANCSHVKNLSQESSSEWPALKKINFIYTKVDIWRNNGTQTEMTTSRHRCLHVNAERKRELIHGHCLPAAFIYV